jgi:hypothetical protein
MQAANASDLVRKPYEMAGLKQKKVIPKDHLFQREGGG